MKFLVSILLMVMMPALLSAGNLLPCPDCRQMVSKRALMCPACGCAGEVIRGVASACVEPAVTGSVLKVDFGHSYGTALPVLMNGRHYAVMPLDDVLGMDRLILSEGTRQIPWTVPEVAISAPLIRLQIEDTNLIYWTVGGDLCYDVFDGCRIGGDQVSAMASCLPFGKESYDLGSCDWQVLQPREMNRHGRILLRLRDGEQCELPFKTHPYYKYLESQWRKEIQE